MNTQVKTSLSVVMPAYNEARHIKENLLSTSEILSTFTDEYEIIAVNDGSCDNTDALINEAAELDSHIIPYGYSENHGKGYAIVHGIEKASGNYVGFLDSDLELPPSLFEGFLKQMQVENCDIVIGSKQHPESQLDYPPLRRFMSYGYYLMLKLLFHLNVHDTQTGIKLYKSEVIKPIAKELSISGYAFDIEILVLANRKGFTISEAPITLNYSRQDSADGRRIRIKDIWRVFTDTVALKRRYH